MSELMTVESIDISRYMGTWYEIAKFPIFFENGLVGVTATYSLLPDGTVSVLNSGYVGSFEGKKKNARGKARVADARTNAKLKVSFFWPFSSDYWIIELGENYEYAAIGNESRKYLWILSRTPQMDESLYEELVHRLKDKGFDTSKLVKNPQK